MIFQMDPAQLYARKQLLEMHRQKLSLTQEQVAKLCGVTTTEYVQWEEGKLEWHQDIDLEELLYYFKNQELHKLVEGSPRVRQDKFD